MSEADGMGVAKEILFIFKAEEIDKIIDPRGDVKVPDKDDVWVIRGEKYKVVASVGPHAPTRLDSTFPIYTVYLTDK